MEATSSSLAVVSLGSKNILVDKVYSIEIVFKSIEGVYSGERRKEWMATATIQDQGDEQQQTRRFIHFMKQLYDLKVCIGSTSALPRVAKEKNW